MFLLTRPSDEKIAVFLSRAQESSFSYSAIGLTRQSGCPAGFQKDHNRIQLGSGAQVFDRSVNAVRAWRMFAMPNAQLCWPTAPIVAGTTVAIAFHHFGFWSINGARIVYTIEGADELEDIQRFGFAYGTLHDHAECGEERFTVEWHHESDAVYYDLFAFSHPAHPLARMAKPLARRLQKILCANRSRRW